MFSASKKAGADLIWSRCRSPVPRSSRDGRVESTGVEEELVAGVVGGDDTVLVAAGIPGTGSRRQVPGVTISTRLATSARVTSNSRSRVHA